MLVISFQELPALELFVHLFIHFSPILFLSFPSMVYHVEGRQARKVGEVCSLERSQRSLSSLIRGLKCIGDEEKREYCDLSKFLFGSL